MLEDDYREDLEFSENEGLLPDRPVFTGLFHPSVFKPLLHKAKLTTNIGVVEGSIEQPQGSTNPHDDLFRIPKPDQEFISCPNCLLRCFKGYGVSLVPWPPLVDMIKKFIALLQTWRSCCNCPL